MRARLRAMVTWTRKWKCPSIPIAGLSWAVIYKVSKKRSFDFFRPEPRVLWYKGDFTIPLHAREKYELHDGNMTLHIKDVKKEDDGSYKCVASNGIGSEDYKMIRLIVQGKQIII